MRPSCFVPLLFAAIVLCAWPAQKMESFAIQPLGEIDPDLISMARSSLAETFGAGVITVLAPQELPSKAFYEPGKRYRAERLLEDLSELRTDQFTKIIGLTKMDISTTKGRYEDWGIFGMAFLGGSACVISSYRLGRDKVDAALFAARVKKVIAHEVGHILGLPHCPTPGCLMADARGLIATVDRSNGRLCQECKKELGHKGRLSYPGI